MNSLALSLVALGIALVAAAMALASVYRARVALARMEDYQKEAFALRGDNLRLTECIAKAAFRLRRVAGWPEDPEPPISRQELRDILEGLQRYGRDKPEVGK